MLKHGPKLGFAVSQRLRVLFVDTRARFSLRQGQLLQIATTQVKLHQDSDLAAEDLRCDGHGEVVDGAHLVSLQAIKLSHVDGRDEENRSAFQARVGTNETRHFEPIHFRHAHIEQDCSKLLLEDLCQRFGSRKCLDAVHLEP